MKTISERAAWLRVAAAFSTPRPRAVIGHAEKPFCSVFGMCHAITLAYEAGEILLPVYLKMIEKIDRNLGERFYLFELGERQERVKYARQQAALLTRRKP